MIRYICLLATLALTVSSQSAEHNVPVSPCPDVFAYEPLGTNDQPLAKRWYGVITLSTDVTLYALWLNVILNHKADILGNWVGEVTTKDNLNFKIENDKFKLDPGTPKLVRFFIQYSQDEIPDLQSILFNGREICKRSEEQNGYTVSKVDGYDTNNGVQKKTKVTTTTERPAATVTRENVNNRVETKDQNRLTTPSTSNYYIHTVTATIPPKIDPIRIDDNVNSLPKKNITQTVTRENVYNREETKNQNRLTTPSTSNYYIHTVTATIPPKIDPIRIDDNVNSLPKKNLTQTVTRENVYNRVETENQNRLTTPSTSNYYIYSVTATIPPKIDPIRIDDNINTQTASSSNKSGSKVQSIQGVPEIKATVYQQALNQKMTTSTSSYSQVSYGSTKISNSLPGTTSSQRQADRNKYQQSRPDNHSKLDTLQTTTAKIWTADTYQTTTECRLPVRPNAPLRPDDRVQNDAGISGSYGLSNGDSSVQNSGLNLHDTSQNNQNSYVPGDGLSDMIQKVMNSSPFNTGESVSVIPISISEPYNTGRQPAEVSSMPTGSIPWSQKPSEQSYGYIDSKFTSQEERPLSDQPSSYGQQFSSGPRPATVIEQEQVNPYSYSSLPIYIPNFKPEETCGKVIIKPPFNLPYGSTTSEGQWPWQAAIYQQQSVHLKYICGGTLVSRSHVITAAHCVTRRKTMQPVNKLTLTVYLGKFNLRTSVEGVQILFVNDIIVYPSFNSTTYSRDLAILQLREQVTYTPWVAPACLWPEDHISLRSIAGRTGSVVGWGVDTSGIPKAELNLLEMPIVEQGDCINSYNFYERFTSAHTFCARYKDDNDVCNSDSGGGMVFKRDNTWFLRGVVSIAVTSHAEGRCDSKHYIIFTDVAKFLPWILEHVDV